MPTDKDKINKATIADLNIIESVDAETLKTIGKTVVEDYKIDDASLTTWKKLKAEALSLFMQHTTTKNFPWDNCSNVAVPILSTAVIQFQARAIEALMPAEDKMRAVPMGVEDSDKARRISKYMNWQLNYQMEEYEEDWDVALFQLAINGSIFRKYYYDPIKKRNFAKYCSASDVIVNYGCQIGLTPKRLTHILRLTKDEIAVRQSKSIFAQLKDRELTAGSTSELSTMDDDISIVSDEIEGQQENSEDSDLPRVVLEQHRRWDLNDDGLEEPYIFTVDKETEQVLRVVKRIYIDPYKMEQEMDFFEHFYFFPNPEGYYGLGFGQLLGSLTETAKTLLNQIIDAATFSNIANLTGFVNVNSKAPKGSLKIKMGHLEKVNMDTDDIRKNIFTFNFAGANPIMFNILDLIQKYSDKVSTVSDILTGELPSSDTPATAIVASIEQGMKVFSTIHKRLHRGLKKEFGKLGVLNMIHGDEREYLEVIGDEEAARALRQLVAVAQQNGQQPDMSKPPYSLKSDYTGIRNVLPVSDPRISSRAEQVAQAEQILQKVMTNPATANDPDIMREAHSRFYQAMHIPEYEKLLQKEQTPPDLPQQEENAMFIRGEMVHALPNQDQLIHIGILDEFIASPYYEELDGNSKNNVDLHRKEHIAFKYLNDFKEHDAGMHNDMIAEEGQGMMAQGAGNA